MNRRLFLIGCAAAICAVAPLMAQGEMKIVTAPSVNGPARLDTSDWTAEYARGWCAGLAFAMERSMQNRDHYRAMMLFPYETHAESMKRISEKWPPRPPDGWKTDMIVDNLLNLVMAGIDLYVVLAPLDATKYRLTLKVAGGEKITCGAEP